MSSLNITTLRNQNRYESLEQLQDTFNFLDKFYYEKEQNFGVGYTYSAIGALLEVPNTWIGNLWDEKDLYIYSILNANRVELWAGTYTKIIKEFKSDKINKFQGKLILTAFKVKEPEVVPELTVVDKTDKTANSEIEELKAELLEIKDLLKKMVV